MLKISAFLTIVSSFYCNAQFYTFNNEQRIGEFNRSVKRPQTAEDIMDPLVYKTLLQPMLRLVGHQFNQSESEMKPEVGDIQLVENVTNIILTATTSNESLTTPILPSQCEVDLGYFKNDLQVGKLYALMMVDSYGKLPPGVFQGGITWPGLYDQCQSQSKSSDATNFKGRHCLVLLANSTPNALFTSINIGMCVPDSCDGGQISSILSGLPSDVGYKVIYTICNKEYEYSASAISCLTLLGFLGMMVLIGTTYDFMKRRKQPTTQNDLPEQTKNDGDHIYESNATNNQNEALIKTENNTRTEHNFANFLLCFSLLINGVKILKTKQGEGSLGSLNGIRVLSLWWVILGHTFSTALFLFSNILNAYNSVTRFTFQAIANGTFSVDSFFFLSGLLITYLTLNHMKKKNGRINWVMFYVHRYLRLTPIYALVIFVFTTLSPHFATGPLYSYAYDPNPDPGVENSITYCQRYWWTNLLYINNLYPKTLLTECLAWGWYLANDMQFFVISPFILYLLYHHFFAGVALWSVLLFTCFGSLIGESITHDITTNFFPEYPGQKQMMSADEVYIKPWARISPYLVGMAMGYILYKYRGRVRMSCFMAIMGWIAASGIGIAVVYGLYGNYHSHPLNDAATVTYITLSRFSWAVALSWVAFACTTGYGGPVNTFLSWSFWIPLSRINYSAYLLHPIIIAAFYLALPNMIYYTDSLMAYFFLGNIVLSYAAAFVLSVCVEGPFIALEKLLFNRDKSV